MTEQQLRRLEDTVFPTPKTTPGRIFLKNNCTSRLYPKPCKISGAIFAVLMQTHCPEHVITQGLWETMGKHMLAICRPVSNTHTTTHTHRNTSACPCSCFLLGFLSCYTVTLALLSPSHETASKFQILQDRQNVQERKPTLICKHDFQAV